MREDISRRRAESDILKDPHGIEAMEGERRGRIGKCILKRWSICPLPELIAQDRILHELLIEVAQLWLET
jgi:hypothetical protein